jgi:hypothetical protein
LNGGFNKGTKRERNIAMSWERYGHRLVYTTTRRRNGKVVRRYYGNGPEAQRVAARNAAAHAQRQAEARLVREAKAQWHAEGETLRQIFHDLGTLVDSTLLTNGYRRHGGEWRPWRI